MAWQDELTRLDQELSAGRIDPDEHRRRRDELLAAASSNPVVQRRQAQPTGRAGTIANAFPGNPPAQRDAEVTQQVIMPQDKQGWQATQPPIAGPQVIEAAPAAPMTGSELFNFPSSGGSRGSSRWPRAVVAVIVLALIAAATWWFAFRTGDGTSTPNAAPNIPVQGGGVPAAGDQITLDQVPSPLADVPLSTAGVISVDQAQVYGLVQPDEAAYLSEGGAEKIFYRWAGTAQLNYAIYAVQAKDGTAAAALTTKANERGKKVGESPATVPNLPQNVTAGKVFGPKSGIFETTYTSGRIAVRIKIVQSGPNNERELETATQRAIAALIKTLPPR